MKHGETLSERHDEVIPQNVLDAIRRHTGVLTNFNTQVETLRTLGAHVGSPGRYEWEYRERQEWQVTRALVHLAEIEVLAEANNVTSEELYAHVGGKPAVLSWSEEAQSWKRSA
jgi:hypothetical protein